MNKWEKEVQESLLNSEEEVLKELEMAYKRALLDLDKKIRELQTEDLTQNRVYRLEHQKALRKQVATAISKLQSDQYSAIDRYLSDVYKTGYVGTMYDMGRQKGGVTYVQPINQDAAVKAIMTDSKIKEGLDATLEKEAKALKKTITKEITRGIAMDLPYADIARSLSLAAKIPESRAKLIARTEGHRIQEASAHDARKVAQSKGARVMKQWDARLDSKTRFTHRKLDGKIVGVDEYFVLNSTTKALYPGGFNDAAQDCNCRCVTNTRPIWDLDEKELRVLEAKATYFQLDKTKDFKEFREKYLKASKTIENSPRASIIKVGALHISDKGFAIHNSKIEHFMLKPGAKHSNEFFDAGYSIKNAVQLLADIEAGYDKSKAVDFKNIDGKTRYTIFMQLGTDKKRTFRTVWIDEGKGTVPQIVTAYMDKPKKEK